MFSPAGIAAPERGTPGRGSGSSTRAPKLSLLSLRLEPPGAEEAFWRQVGAPVYTASDKWALLFTIMNIAVSMLHFKPYVEGTSRLLHFTMFVIHFGQLLFAIMARMVLWWNETRFRELRGFFALGNRVSRSVYLLVSLFMQEPDDWRRIVRRPRTASPSLPLTAEAASTLALRWLFLSALMWAMQTFLFPVAFRVAAPLQLFFCTAACFALKKFACDVRADAVLFAGAELLCNEVAAAKESALSVLGLMHPSAAAGALNALGVRSSASGSSAAGGGFSQGACAVAPVEMLVPLFNALSCLIAAALLYFRELTLKLRWLRTQGTLCHHDLFEGVPGPLSVIVGVVAISVAALCTAEVAGGWGHRYTC